MNRSSGRTPKSRSSVKTVDWSTTAVTMISDPHHPTHQLDGSSGVTGDRSTITYSMDEKSTAGRTVTVTWSLVRLLERRGDRPDQEVRWVSAGLTADLVARGEDELRLVAGLLRRHPLHVVHDHVSVASSEDEPLVAARSDDAGDRMLGVDDRAAPPRCQAWCPPPTRRAGRHPRVPRPRASRPPPRRPPRDRWSRSIRSSRCRWRRRSAGTPSGSSVSCNPSISLNASSCACSTPMSACCASSSATRSFNAAFSSAIEGRFVRPRKKFSTGRTTAETPRCRGAIAPLTAPPTSSRGPPSWR